MKAKAIRIQVTRWYATNRYNALVTYASGAHKEFTGYAEDLVHALWDLPFVTIAGHWHRVKETKREAAEGEWWECKED